MNCFTKKCLLCRAKRKKRIAVTNYCPNGLLFKGIYLKNHFYLQSMVSVYKPF
ncbi:hypothetical protein MOUN0_B00166 [Monosporozyma unispora]